MKNILITGATGNVGKEVINNLRKKDGKFQIIAGLRDENQMIPFRRWKLQTSNFLTTKAWRRL